MKMTGTRASVLCKGSRGAGFTLIELLVVVAIISLLMGILLPSLSKARETARRSVCLSNLKNVGAMLIMYDQMYRSLPGRFYPCVLDPKVVNADPAILTSTMRKMILTSTTGPFAEFLNGSDKIWYCPSSQIIRETATPASTTSAYYGVKLGYCYKINNSRDSKPDYIFGSFNSESSSTVEDLRPKSIASIEGVTDELAEKGENNPATIWAMSDLDSRNYSTGASTGTGIALSSQAIASRPFQPAHNENPQGANIWGRNYVFLDGHAAFARGDERPASY